MIFTWMMALQGVTDVKSLINLIPDAHTICASNDRRVIETILRLERTKDLVDLDLLLENLSKEP